MSNLELWDKVFKTNPEHTKEFKKAGGFSGTAIKPFYIMHEATKAFGVCGIYWGWKELENQLVGGVWCSKVELWFKYDGKDGRIEQWGQTVMLGKNKHGDFVDEEAPKKAITDAVTKCLSYLGFGGDVHMGKFDDSKYVSETQNEFNSVEKKETAAARNKRYVELMAKIENSDDPAVTWQENIAFIKEIQAHLPEHYNQLIDIGASRKKQLEEMGRL